MECLFSTDAYFLRIHRGDFENGDVYALHHHDRDTDDHLHSHVGVEEVLRSDHILLEEAVAEDLRNATEAVDRLRKVARAWAALVGMPRVARDQNDRVALRFFWTHPGECPQVLLPDVSAANQERCVHVQHPQPLLDLQYAFHLQLDKHASKRYKKEEKSELPNKLIKNNWTSLQYIPYLHILFVFVLDKCVTSRFSLMLGDRDVFDRTKGFHFT